MRTKDLLGCAAYTSEALDRCFSLEMWGGATFDVSMRFLHECPWERLEQLRAAVPNVPFQMLLRGANAVGYTNYPDNVVYKFCEQAKKSGIDIFRVFDSLNYLDNLKLGVDAALAAGAFVEGAISYTGDVANPAKTKYNLEYYVNLARELQAMGVHSLAIKDMAGLLTPRSASLLVSAIRKECPELPIHVHTHDTAGAGVASMLAAAEAGADIVDVAIDAMSGLTSQPSLGAMVANLAGSRLDTGLDPSMVGPLNSYWETVRSNLYVPFESGQLSTSSDVYEHEIPGGQYTNLLYQSRQLGLSAKWPEIKAMYAKANLLLGDIPKVTPSSKVVGDLAQFMVSQRLEPEDVLEQAETLAFPESVVEYFQGAIGIPPGGFPEPLRTKMLKGRAGKVFDGRPGASLPPYDFAEAESKLRQTFGQWLSDKDVLSHAMYPKVFNEWKKYELIYGEVGNLPTHLFLKPMEPGQEVSLELEKGKSLLVKLVSIPPPNEDGIRQVIMELNGERWFVSITDEKAGAAVRRREKAGAPGTVGATMPGVIVDIKVKQGDFVKEGDQLAVLSSMKMETVIPAPATGIVERVLVSAGDNVAADDLLAVIGDAKPPTSGGGGKVEKLWAQ